MATDTVNALCSLANAKMYIGMKDDSTEFDTRIESYIDAASWYLNDATKRKLLARSLTEYYDGRGSDVLVTKERPINSVTTLHSDANRSFGSTTLIAATDYQVYGDEGYIVVTGSAFDVGERVLKLVYNAGFTTVPYDLEQAALELTAYWYEYYKSHRVGIKTQSVGDKQTTYADMPPFVTAVIRKYTRLTIG